MFERPNEFSDRGKLDAHVLGGAAVLHIQALQEEDCNWLDLLEPPFGLEPTTCSASTRKTDPTLLKAVARGHKWFNELISGQAVFTREIAAREGVNERFVRRLIPLAFLSPAIVQAIVEGRHPADLTGEALSRGIDIPVEWAKQDAALGFK